jgi:hypothetical protein
MPSLAAARSIEPAHEQLGLPRGLVTPPCATSLARVTCASNPETEDTAPHAVAQWRSGAVAVRLGCNANPTRVL